MKILWVLAKNMQWRVIGASKLNEHVDTFVQSSLKESVCSIRLSLVYHKSKHFVL